MVRALAPCPLDTARAFALLALMSLLLALPARVAAQAGAEFSGQMGSFAADVLQDLALDGKSAEESGQTRLKSFVEGKLLGSLKSAVTGGDDLSEGMGLILNRIYDALNSHQRRRGGRPGMCDLAAINQAHAIAFDAKNLRLLRGSANVWFDLVTSGIRGAPGLAEKLVNSTAQLGYEKLRAGLEKQVKDWWAAQKPETFTYSRSSGPCTLSMTVIWNKQRGRYLFLIKGSCDCKLVAINPPYVGGNITMKGFELIGGGDISVSLDTRDASRPRVRINTGIPRYELNSNCQCAIPESRLPPPPPPEEEPVTLPEQGQMRQATGVRCPACQPLLDQANTLAGEFNALAAKMNALASTIVSEKFNTPERANNLARWQQWKQQLDALEQRHDKVFIEFAACEERECTNTDPIGLPVQGDAIGGSTDCEPCIARMQALNADVAKHNSIVAELNELARYAARTELRRGTREGNDLYAKWQQLEAARVPLASAIERGRAELSACQARECGAWRWEPWELWRPVTGTCPKCQGAQDAANAAIERNNEIVRKINAGRERERAYVEQHGDSWGPGLDGLVKLRDEYGLHTLLAQQREALEQVNSALAALRACERQWCVAVEVVDVKNLTGNDPFEQRDPIAPEASEAGVAGSESSTQAPVASGPTIDVLFIGGKPVPLAQFVVEDHTSPPPVCPDHYHAANFSDVQACDGSTIPDPFACPGYGFIGNVPVQTIPLAECANP